MVLEDVDDYVPRMERTKLKERNEFLSAINAKKKYKKEVDICKAIAELAIKNDWYKIEDLVYELNEEEIALLPKKMKIERVTFSCDSSGESEGTICFHLEKDEVKDFYFSQKNPTDEIVIESA